MVLPQFHQFSCSVTSDSLWPHEPSAPGLPVHHQTRVYPNSWLLSQWGHPTISSSLILFSSHTQSFPASGSFLFFLLFFLYFYFILLFLNFIFTLFYFTILYWFCHTLTWIRHGCTHVPNPEPTSHLPPHTILLGHPSAPAPSIQYHASNLDWWFVSYMILYMFQCYSLKTSYPFPRPQSPKACSIHKWLVKLYL